MIIIYITRKLPAYLSRGNVYAIMAQEFESEFRGR
jgi:hypothetical protein